MSHVGRKHGRGADELIAESRALLGDDRAAAREAQVAALPRVEWNGRTLYTLRCLGTSGRGNHDVNVPLLQCWTLIDIKRFFCVYHAGDAFGVK